MRAAGLLALGWAMVAAGAAWAEAPPEPATLRHFNREVAVMRAPLLGAPPAQRVAAAEVRLEAALKETTGAEVTLQPVDLGRAVLLNQRLLFFVQPADVDPESGLTLDQAAGAAADRLREALAASAAQREADGLLLSATRAGVGLLVYLLLTVLVLALRTRLVRLLERFFESRPETLRIGSLGLVRWQTLSLLATGLIRTLTGLLLLVLGVQWLALALRQFPLTQPWGAQLQDLLGSAVERGAALAARTLPDLAVVVLIVLLARWAIGVSRAIFRQAQAGRWASSWLTPATAGITHQLVSVGIWLFALVMAYPYLPGSESQAFKGLTVLLGLMATLGGSSTVGQAAAGLILIYGRSFAVGDQVRIGDAAGTVTAIGMFTTRLRNLQGEELVLPNSAVLAATTRKYTTAGPGVRLEVTVTIGYDTPWKQVQALLLEGARRTTTLLPEPAPEVTVTALDDFYVGYRLVAAAPATEVREAALDRLRRNVLDAFAAARVQIMSPHYRSDPAEPKVPPPEPAPREVAAG